MTKTEQLADQVWYYMREWQRQIEAQVHPRAVSEAAIKADRELRRAIASRSKKKDRA